MLPESLSLWQFLPSLVVLMFAVIPPQDSPKAIALYRSPLNVDNIERLLLQVAVLSSPMQFDETVEQSPREKPIPFEKRLGQAIRSRRIELGLSQVKVGMHLGFSQQSISGIEFGRVSVDAKTLFDLADVLECPIEYFDVRLSGNGKAIDRVNGRSGGVSVESRRWGDSRG